LNGFQIAGFVPAGDVQLYNPGVARHPSGGGFTTYWTFAVTYFIAALLMFVIFGPK
jgi:hypothetical protein